MKIQLNHGRLRIGVVLGALVLVAGVPTVQAGAAPAAQPSHANRAWSSVLQPDQHRFRSARSGALPRSTSSTKGRTSPVPTASTVAFDATTQTLYVTSELDDAVAVIDARSCNARRTRCQDPIATMPGFATDSGVQLDVDHRTLYVATHQGDVVGVLDLRHCTARDTSGCSAAPGTVPVGPGSVGMTLDRATHTLYVGSETSPIAVVDTATCNGHNRTGCDAPVATLGGPSLFPSVDPTTDTLYAPVAPDNGDPGIQVWDVSACRAGHTAGCSGSPVGFAPIGAFSLFVFLDHRSGTLFTGNVDDNSLSLIDSRTCNAHEVSSCGRDHPTARIQLGPEFAVADPHTRTLYVMASSLDQAAAIDLDACTVRSPDGCPTRPRTLQLSAHPYWLDLDPATGTLYAVSPVENSLQAFDARSCSARRTVGCRREAPTAEGQVAELDPTRHTAYQVFDTQPALGLLDTSRCNSTKRTDCTGIVRVPLGQRPGSAAVDVATHTLYVMDQQAHQLLVIDTSRCSASRRDGCTPFASIGLTEAGLPGLNPRTHTVYVSTFDGSMAVIDGAHCNALDRTGCTESALRIPVGGSPYAIWVDPTSNTVYVTDIDVNDNVFLLDGAACEARTAGCRKIAETTVGSHPAGLTGNIAAHTVYVANYAYTDEPGSLSLLDTRHCRAGDVSGCDTTWPRAAAGHSTYGVRYDPATDTVFTANLQGTVSVIPARRCTAGDQHGCPNRPPRIAVGTYSVAAYLDSTAHTLYVLNAGGGEGTSIIDTHHPCRPRTCFR